MYEKFGCVTKEYKARFRTLMFNLQDTKVCLRRQESLASAELSANVFGTVWQNPDFIQAVVTGQRHVSDLAGMDVKEMASESMKKQQLKYSENAKMALMDTKSYEKYAGKEINDGILKCPKCKSMKTEYTEVQTRSADEPTTKKCFCNTCNYRWKCAACHCAHAKASLVSPPIPCHQVLLSLRFFPTSLLLGGYVQRDRRAQGRAAECREGEGGCALVWWWLRVVLKAGRVVARLTRLA